MEKFYSKIIGIPVFVDGEKRPLTSVKELVIDPKNGEVVAFVTNISKNLVVVPIDIISWDSALKINDSDAIIEGHEVVRVAEVQKNPSRFAGNRVETENGAALGKVFDLSIDNSSYQVKLLHVAKGFLGLLRYDQRLIPTKYIIEVLEDRIVVKDDLKVIELAKRKDVGVEELAMG